MAKKKKTQKLKREPTKRQLSHWQQQKKRQRIIFSVGVSIILAAIMILTAGWYFGQYQPLHETAIRVNGTEFNMKYYIERLKLYGTGLSESYMDYLASSVITDIEQDVLIKQEAPKLGISVSNDEIKNKLKDSEQPNSDVRRDLAEQQLLMEKLLDNYFEQQVPQTGEQVDVMAMLLESRNQAAEVRNRLESGDNFTELAGEFSLNYLTKTKEGNLGWNLKNILTDSLATSIVADYAFDAEIGILSQPLYDAEVNKGVGYWIIKVPERDEEGEEAHVYAILIGTEEEAKYVRARLDAGEDFATLAKKFSQLTSVEENGGDLDMVTQGTLPTVADDFIFNTDIELGTISEPIRDDTVGTKGGYWLVRVVDKDSNKQIEEQDRNSLKNQAFDDWVATLWELPNNEIDDSYLTDEKQTWAIEQVQKK